MGQDYATRAGGEQIQRGELRIDIERPRRSGRSDRLGRHLLRDAVKRRGVPLSGSADRKRLLRTDLLNTVDHFVRVADDSPQSTAMPLSLIPIGLRESFLHGSAQVRFHRVLKGLERIVVKSGRLAITPKVAQDAAS